MLALVLASSWKAMTQYLTVTTYLTLGTGVVSVGNTVSLGSLRNEWKETTTFRGLFKVYKILAK